MVQESRHPALQKLLEDSPKEWQRRAEQVDLPPPETLLAEDKLWRATLEGPHPVEEQGKQSSWLGLIAHLSTWQRLGLAVTFCLGLFLVGTSLQEPSRDILQPKTMKQRRRALTFQPVLQLGFWNKSKASVQRLVRGASVSSKGGLAFGFFLKKQGYISLLFQKRSSDASEVYKTEAIYPFGSAKSPQYKAQKTLHVLAHRGSVLTYNLQGLKGVVRFLLVQTRNPQKPSRWLPCLQSKAWNSSSLPGLLKRCHASVVGVDMFSLVVKQ